MSLTEIVGVNTSPQARKSIQLGIGRLVGDKKVTLKNLQKLSTISSLIERCNEKDD